MRIIIVAVAALSITAAVAQHGGHRPQEGASRGHATPYAGFQHREIKALSPEQIADLRAARGMGLATAAELNRYPGPMHVLEHADALALTSEQRQTMEALMVTMKRDAVAAGEALIAAERELDRLFASGEADEARLATLIRAVSEAQGNVRQVHLATHIATRRALTSSQVATYERVRGYAHQ